MNRKFDLEKEFVIPGVPSESSFSAITRADYEGLPAPMIAHILSDEQMQQLADNIGREFGYKDLLDYYKSSGVSEEMIDEEIGDTFWRVMEDEAFKMGMLYYEDLDEDEYDRLIGK